MSMDRFRPHSPAERAHPLVRRLFTEMNEQQCSQQTMSERSGINKNTFRSWLTKAVPRLQFWFVRDEKPLGFFYVWRMHIGQLEVRRLNPGEKRRAR